MLRWIVRMVLSGLRADGRWLVPIVLSASFALASLVPVEALQDASTRGFARYCARVLGADLRIEVDSLSAEARGRLGELLDSAAEQGAEIARVYEMVAPMRRGATQIPVRVVVVTQAPVASPDGVAHLYPFYGGELWSVAPAKALAEGVALSTNAVRSLGAAEGDTVTLAGSRFAVTATFPENLLTMASSGSGGSAVVAADKLGVSPAVLSRAAEVIAVKLPSDPDAASRIKRSLKDALGRASVLGSEEIMPVIEVGLTRLKQTYLWCALLILFMCAFGLAFGVEDYTNSKGDEIATLKILGFSPGLVGLVLALRLVLAGLAGGLLAVGLGSLMTSVTVAVAGTEAADLADLARLSGVPWDLFLIGPILVLVFGAFPLLVRLLEKPHRVLWSKMRGFPLATRTGAGLGSLLSALVLAVPVMVVLVRWYCGPGEAPMVGTIAILGMGVLVLASVAAMIWLVSGAGRRLPVRFRWPFTYLRVGRGRLVASATAVAFALAVGSGTALVDRVVTWELQAAVRRQVPFSVGVLLPHGTLTSAEEEAVSRHLSSLPGVDYSAYCDVGWAYSGGRRAVLIKAPKLGEAALFGSILAEHASAAPPGSVPCTLWEERTNLEVGNEVTIALGSSPTSGPEGKAFSVVVVGLDPRPGLRVGLNAPITVPTGTLDMPVFRFLGVRADPAYTSGVARELEAKLPRQAEVYDVGPVEVMLRTAAEELSFVWWATAFFAVLVSVVIFLTTSSVSRLMRSYELALLRVLGIAGWRLGLGPYAEAAAQGVISGLAGGLVAYLLVYRGLPLFLAVDLPPEWMIPAAAVAVSVVLSLLLQSVALRADLRRSALEALRSE